MQQQKKNFVVVVLKFNEEKKNIETRPDERESPHFIRTEFFILFLLLFEIFCMFEAGHLCLVVFFFS